MDRIDLRGFRPDIGIPSRAGIAMFLSVLAAACGSSDTGKPEQPVIGDVPSQANCEVLSEAGFQQIGGPHDVESGDTVTGMADQVTGNAYGQNVIASVQKKGDATIKCGRPRSFSGLFSDDPYSGPGHVVRVYQQIKQQIP